MPDGDGLTIQLMQGFDPVAQFTTYIDAQPNNQRHPLFIPTPSPRLYSPARQDFGRTTPVMASTLPFIDSSAPGLGTVRLPPLDSSPHQQHEPPFVHVPGQQLSSGQTLPSRSRNTPRTGLATEHRDRTASTIGIFQCDWKGCDARPTFHRSADLWRHIKHLHLSPGSHVCLIDGCGRSFNRNDNLTEHALRVHGYPSIR
ncbi:uncharacterized protein BO66DRAFT_388477 [Aspergillus aculeatinus CBS 121060]|uniref:Uncharacterized protein n=1 Tax=Aspergillus aculeatinus CBS 121060 TaxID=1448322 RepID=A0ACD1HK54_9EURO|nr:hypothetical protein BO66DRAFT_388477 [Aspergillus aculeatinus CBS 121060]RAH73795.1 hypothetical protein BO66DRAFT_388477 [Aspergillus aculeatinus CBS 121060]